MAVNIGKFSQPQLYNYGYDQLNRLVSMDVYRGLTESTNTWNNNLSAIGDYKERIAYDANGNIKKYLRQGYGSNLDMDSLNYNYNAGTNQLNHVRDQVSLFNYNEDVDNQPNNTYHYDEIGNLIYDDLKGITSIGWNVYGKIKTINRYGRFAGDATSVEYTYDPSGNRVGKTIGEYSGTGSHKWYVRDAQGNVMAAYDHHYNSDWSLGPLKLSEHHIYGSSRLGIVQRDQDMEEDKAEAVSENLVGNTYLYQDSIGKRMYELSNHLGNVLAVPCFAISLW